jgi:hypothetical protein
MVDDLILWGPPERIRERVRCYVENGLDTPVLALFGFPAIDRARQSAAWLLAEDTSAYWIARSS